MSSDRSDLQTVRCLAAVVMLALCPALSMAATINVPADYASIQAAINAASDGDEVVVAPDRYYENIDFRGKAITVRSTDPDDRTVVAATIIDGQENGSVVVLKSAEGPDSVLTGLTVTKGRRPRGGGVRCIGTSPTITRNAITGNWAGWSGGGIYCDGRSPTITGNTISDNSAGTGGGIYCTHSDAAITGNTISSNSGGGIYCYRSRPQITSNTISSNSGAGIYCEQLERDRPQITGNTISSNSGGGIFCRQGRPQIVGNTISGNSRPGGGGGIHSNGAAPTIASNKITGNSANEGGGIYCWLRDATITGNTITGNSASKGGGIYCSGCSPTISNTIVAFSPSGGGIWAGWRSTPTASYCAVYGNAGGDYVGFTPSGPGNIWKDPLFADAAAGDFHLKSTGGRWDPVSENWVHDAEHSPCINRGDPAADWSSEPLPNGGRLNMGAYGNTPEASKSRRLHLPELSWLGTTGYESDGVDPDEGAGGDTRFCFKVLYADPDGHAPRSVTAQLRRSGKPFREFAMARGIGDYTSGRVYRRTRKLPPGNYEHCFKARDRDGLATGDATVWTPGPIVGPRTAVALTSLSAVPTNTGTQITFSLSSAAEVQARILNIAGRPVKTLCRARDCGAGTSTLVWNATSDHGLAVPNGTYLVEVTAKVDDGTQTRGLAQVRLKR